MSQEHTWAGTGTQGTALTQVMANKFMAFDTLAKHSTVNSKKHAAVPSVLVEEFENRFQDGQNGSYHCFVSRLHFLPYQLICDSGMKTAWKQQHLLALNTDN